MKRRAARGETIVTGIITPSAWDESFNVTSVKISTPGEKEYLIDHQGKGKELFRFVRENLRIRGQVRDDPGGNRVISVEEYERIQT
jgi:hypothetical protein